MKPKIETYDNFEKGLEKYKTELAKLGKKLKPKDIDLLMTDLDKLINTLKKDFFKIIQEFSFKYMGKELLVLISTVLYDIEAPKLKDDKNFKPLEMQDIRKFLAIKLGNVPHPGVCSKEFKRLISAKYILKKRKKDPLRLNKSGVYQMKFLYDVIENFFDLDKLDSELLQALNEWREEV